MVDFRRLALCLTLCLLGPVLASPDVGSSPELFVPEGWEVQTLARGDLNGDGTDDLAMVVRGTDQNLLVEAGHFTVGTPMVDPKTGTMRVMMNTNPRNIVVLLASERGFEKLAANSGLLPVPSYPNGDALDGIDIVNGKLSLGLTYADRRHGELYSKVRFHFQMMNGRLVLSQGSRLQLRRYTTDLEETREFDFLRHQMTSTKFRFSTHELLEEERNELESSPTLEFSGVTSESPMPSWEPDPVYP